MESGCYFGLAKIKPCVSRALRYLQGHPTEQPVSTETQLAKLCVLEGAPSPNFYEVFM